MHCRRSSGHFGETGPSTLRAERLINIVLEFTAMALDLEIHLSREALRARRVAVVGDAHDVAVVAHAEVEPIFQVENIPGTVARISNLQIS